MIEIYIFVNPIDHAQMQPFQQLFKLIKHSNKNIKFHIIPAVTMPLMDGYFTNKLIPRHQREKRNSLFQLAYHIAISYEKLATLNKQASINFLLKTYDLLAKDTCAIQDIDQLLIQEGYGCCKELQYHLEQYSDIAKEKFQNNLKLANDMGISNLSSLVIYNFNSSKDFAIRLDSIDDLDLINNLIDANSIEEAIEKQPMSLQ